MPKKSNARTKAKKTGHRKIEIMVTFTVRMPLDISEQEFADLDDGRLDVENLSGFDETEACRLCGTTSEVDYDWGTRA